MKRDLRSFRRRKVSVALYLELIFFCFSYGRKRFYFNFKYNWTIFFIQNQGNLLCMISQETVLKPILFHYLHYLYIFLLRAGKCRRHLYLWQSSSDYSYLPLKTPKCCQVKSFYLLFTFYFDI